MTKWNTFIVSALAIGLLTACEEGDSVSDSAEDVIDEVLEEETEEVVAEESPEEESVQEEDEQKTQEPEDYNSDLTYDDLARTDDHLSSNVQFSGTVVQIMTGTDYTQIRMAIDDNYDEILFVEYDHAILDQRLLENDSVDIYGEYWGMIEYETVLGSTLTVPGIVADKVELNEESTGESLETKDQEQSGSTLGKRSNPVPMGESIQVKISVTDDDFNSYPGVASISLNNVIRGEEAYTALIAMNQFNEEAPEGYEWAIFDVTFTVDELSTEDVPVFVSPNIKGFGSDGSESPDEYATTDPEFGWVDLYAGGSTEGKEAVLLPVDDEDALIEFSDWEYSVFFSTK